MGTTRTRAPRKPRAKQPPQVAPGAEHATVAAPAPTAPDPSGVQTRKAAYRQPSGDAPNESSQEAAARQRRNARCLDCGASDEVPAHGPGCTQAA